MMEIRTLGAGAVVLNGAALDRLTAQRQKFALLAYLGVEGPVSRDRLLGVFWGERPEERARHSLNQALYALRRELGEGWIESSGDVVGLARAVRVDALELEAAAREERWGAVAELYEDPFLERFTFPDSAAFEDWQGATRARLARHARRAFAHVVAARVVGGRLQEALTVAWRWATLEPLEDEAQHALIGLLALSGDRAGALRQFEGYRERLERELEVEPLEQTLALVERLRAGDLSDFELLGTRVAPPPESHPARTPAPEPPPASPRATPSGQPPRIREPAAAYAAAPASEPSRRRATEATPSERIAHPWQRMAAELRARPVFQITALYLAVSWVAIQVADVLTEREMLPAGAFRLLLLGFAAGLPLVMAVGWAHEREARPSGSRRPRARLSAVQTITLLAVGMLALVGAQSLLESAAMSAAYAARSELELDPGRLAVLYLDDHSPAGDQEAMAAGLTQALIQELSAVAELDVLSRNAVKQYRDGSVPPDSIGRALRVGTLVEGSILRSGDRIRVSVHLVDANTGEQQVIEPVERPVTEILELQAELAEEVARHLRTKLGENVRRRGERAGTRDAAAWELVQRASVLAEDGVTLARRDTAAARAALHSADSLLARAAERDPAWPVPMLERARLRVREAKLASPTPGKVEPALAEQALALIEPVLERHPEHASALAMKGEIIFELADVSTSPEEAAALYREAEAMLRAAVQSHPGQARAWWYFSSVLRVQGRFAPARRAAERALEADAYLEEAGLIVHQLYHTAFEMEDHADAVRWCDEGRRRFPRDARFQTCALFLLASSPLRRPDADAAWAHVDTMVSLIPTSTQAAFRAFGQVQVAKVLMRMELRDSAHAVLRRAWGEVTPAWLAYDEAHARLLGGEREAALKLLQRYVTEYAPNRREYLPRDWWFRDLWDDTRFRRLTEVPGGS
ncbi:MAG TPA: BTAD domain-containing putative transcriptional regulator [Longimicrobiales bacterium]|nr:BTAD domain-containing putative transcriptional regulator [Longimicrobiales bacterium]